MAKQKKITILIPCHDEERGLGLVIKSVPYQLLKKNLFELEVVVVNNNSTDKTEQVAKKFGAKVVYEKKIGKGNAIRKGFSCISKNTDIVVIIDGDSTYKTNEIIRIIEPIENGFADVVVGSRLSGKTMTGSLTAQHRLANWFYTFIVRHFYRVNTTDVLSGFIGMRGKLVREILPFLESTGFAIEMELNIKASRLGYSIYSVPITYDVREGESKIEGFKDALRIFQAFLKYLHWKPQKRQGSS